MKIVYIRAIILETIFYLLAQKVSDLDEFQVIFTKLTNFMYFSI